MSDEQLRKYEAELARLDELFLDLERLWKRMPKLFAFALAAPLVWYIAGFAWAVVTVLVVLALVGTEAYLLSVRKGENRASHALLAKDLAELRAAKGGDGAPGATTPGSGR